jgi:uncharacterized protein
MVSSRIVETSKQQESVMADRNTDKKDHEDQRTGGDTATRGFATMDEKKKKEIASQGGQASGGNFANDPDRAAEAGRKGGEAGGDRQSDRVPDRDRSEQADDDQPLSGDTSRKRI